MIGCCGFHRWGDAGELELGFHLARAWWGRGYATEAARACVRHGFDALAAPRIVAGVHPDNAASIRVLEKLGMRSAGEDGGDLLYELLP